MQSQVTELNASITELNSQVASWKKKAEDGEVTISEKDTQISNLNSQISAKNSEIEEKQSKIQELEGNVTTLTNEKQSLETQVATLNTRVAELEGNQATGDATAADVLAGKTFSTANGVNLTGTMANRGTLNWIPNSPDTYEIQPGYYEGGTLSPINIYESMKEKCLAGQTIEIGRNNENTKNFGEYKIGTTYTIPSECKKFEKAYYYFALILNGLPYFGTYGGETTRYYEFTGDSKENWQLTNEVKIEELVPGNTYMIVESLDEAVCISEQKIFWLQTFYIK